MRLGVGHVHLTVLQHATDMIRCEPYQGTIEAGQCIERQRRAGNRTAPKEAFTRGPGGDYRLCMGCPIGPKVALQLGAQVPRLERRPLPVEEEADEGPRLLHRQPVSCPGCKGSHPADECPLNEVEEDLSPEERSRQARELEEEIRTNRERRTGRVFPSSTVRPGKQRGYHCSRCGNAGHNKNSVQCPKKKRGERGPNGGDGDRRQDAPVHRALDVGATAGVRRGGARAARPAEEPLPPQRRRQRRRGAKRSR